MDAALAPTRAMTPEVSVVIPTFNRCAMVREAAASVLAQRGAAFELIVVDDGSTDGTADELERIAAAHPGVMQVERGEHRGAAAARNRGVVLARARLIAFLDSDDFWAPDKLARQLAYVRAHPEYAISQTNEIWIRNRRRINPARRHRKRAGDIFIDSLRTCLVSPSAVIVRTELVRGLGGFDEGMAAAEDYDLWLRVLVDHEAGLLDEPLVTRRAGHPDQLSAITPALDRFRILALAKLLADERVGGEKRVAVADVMAEKCVIYARGLRRRGFVADAAFYERASAGRVADGRDHRDARTAHRAPAIRGRRGRSSFVTAVAATDDAIRALAAERHLDTPHLDMWLNMEVESRAALLEVARRLKLRTGQIVAALELLNEIAVRERATVAAILAREDVARIAAGAGSAPQRARALLDALRALRYPRLGRTFDRIRAEVRALKLPRTISIEVPKELGSDELAITLSVRSAAEFDAALHALGEQRAALARIIDLLGGKDGA